MKSTQQDMVFTNIGDLQCKISIRKSTKSALKSITIKHILVQSQLPTNNRTIIKIFIAPAKNFETKIKPQLIKSCQ